MTDRRRGLPRREFLRVTAATGAAALVGCADEESPRDTSDATADAGDAALDASPDVVVDAAPDAAHDAAPDAADTAPDAAPAPAIELTKGPWVQQVPGGRMRLRFESALDVAAVVRVLVDDVVVEAATSRATTTVDYTWPPPPLEIDNADTPGDYTLHDVIIDAPPAGSRVRWEVHDGEAVHEGELATAPAPGQGFRLGWIADTMAPLSTDAVAVLAAQSPDLVIHGGDLQYMSSPFDTWDGFFATMQPLTRSAAMHTIVGNHEYEEQDEYDQHYLRLLAGQGDDDQHGDRHAFTWGAVRFVCMNSEVDFGDVDGPQHAWLVAELDAASQNAAIEHVVVAFHRPLYSFSKHRPPRDARAVLHPLLRDAGVRLVLAGHVHAYERFEHEGVTYLVDGGGGALSYNPDESLEEIERDFPEEIERRIVADRSMGVTTVDIAGATLLVTRFDLDGEVVDTFTIG